MDRIVVYQGQNGGWRWHRVAANGRVTSTSGEEFDSKYNAVRAAEAEADGTDAEVVVKDAEDA